VNPVRFRWEGIAMSRWSRPVSLVVALVLFAWMLSHAGGFNPDGSPVDSDPPSFSVMLGSMVLYAVLVVYGTGGCGAGRCGPAGDGGAADAGGGCYE
jgi:hypothetical protein